MFREVYLKLTDLAGLYKRSICFQ